MSTLKVGAWVGMLTLVGAGYAAAANNAKQVGPYKGAKLAPQGGGGPYTCSIGATKLLDNGDTDGSNGYSNAVVGVFGARRTLLDDFVVPAPGFVLDEFAWRHLWNSFPSGSGTGLEMSIRSDAGGSPGPVIMTLTPSGYTEAATGRVWFGRPENESHANLGGAVLPAGNYWFEFTIVGPDNNFEMVKGALVGSTCWVVYDDLSGGQLQDCPTQFGETKDLTWALCGSILPVELQDFNIQ